MYSLGEVIASEDKLFPQNMHKDGHADYHGQKRLYCSVGTVVAINRENISNVAIGSQSHDGAITIRACYVINNHFISEIRQLKLYPYAL